MVMVQTRTSVGGVLTVRVQQWHSIQGKQISTLQWLHPTVSLATLLVSDAHQASYKGHNLGRWSAGIPEPPLSLTRRGRMSTMSSGTRKINAFILRAIEMASLAVQLL